jgi:hypothetical protein
MKSIITFGPLYAFYHAVCWQVQTKADGTECSSFAYDYSLHRFSKLQKSFINNKTGYLIVRQLSI